MLTESISRYYKGRLIASFRTEQVVFLAAGRCQQFYWNISFNNMEGDIRDAYALHNNSSVFLSNVCKVQPAKTFTGLTRNHRVAVRKKIFPLYYAIGVLSLACLNLLLQWGSSS